MLAEYFPPEPLDCRWVPFAVEVLVGINVRVDVDVGITTVSVGVAVVIDELQLERIMMLDRAGSLKIRSDTQFIVCLLELPRWSGPDSAD